MPGYIHGLIPGNTIVGMTDYVRNRHPKRLARLAPDDVDGHVSHVCNLFHCSAHYVFRCAALMAMSHGRHGRFPGDRNLLRPHGDPDLRPGSGADSVADVNHAAELLTANAH